MVLPIEVVAFSEGGQYVSHRRLTKAEDKLTLSLAEGRYRLVAFSGVGAYTLPAEGVTPKSPITQKNIAPSGEENTNAATLTDKALTGKALMRGEAEIEGKGKQHSRHPARSHHECCGVSLVANPR